MWTPVHFTPISTGFGFSPPASTSVSLVLSPSPTPTAQPFFSSPTGTLASSLSAHAGRRAPAAATAVTPFVLREYQQADTRRQLDERARAAREGAFASVGLLPTVVGVPAGKPREGEDGSIGAGTSQRGEGGRHEGSGDAASSGNVGVRPAARRRPQSSPGLRKWRRAGDPSLGGNGVAGEGSALASIPGVTAPPEALCREAGSGDHSVIDTAFIARGNVTSGANDKSPSATPGASSPGASAPNLPDVASTAAAAPADASSCSSPPPTTLRMFRVSFRASSFGTAASSSPAAVISATTSPARAVATGAKAASASPAAAATGVPVLAPPVSPHALDLSDRGIGERCVMNGGSGGGGAGDAGVQSGTGSRAIRRRRRARAAERSSLSKDSGDGGGSAPSPPHDLRALLLSGL